METLYITLDLFIKTPQEISEIYTTHNPIKILYNDCNSGIVNLYV